MTVMIMNTNKAALAATSGGALGAFAGLSVADTAPLGGTETVTIKLAPIGFLPVTNGLGSITDPTTGGTFDPATATFTEDVLVTGVPTGATSLLQRLAYNAPTLAAGISYDVNATVTVTSGGFAQSSPVTIDVITAPGITHTTANQPVASGSPDRPFATTQIIDEDLDETSLDTAKITITEGGTPNDSDGFLSGPGLSQIGVGTYAISGYFPWNLTNLLQNLTFATRTLTAGQTANPQFELDVTNAKSGLTTKDTATSLLISGPPPIPVVPSIAGTLADQSVAPGNIVDPFHGVTITDANPTPLDTATIRITNAAGTATDANGTFGSQSWMTHVVGSGIYTITAASPATLTTELDTLVFSPAPVPTGQTSVTSNFELDVTDNGVSKTATDTTTTLTETATPINTPPQPPASNFLVHDETTGQVYQSPGDPYTGPVAGITSEIIFATTDNINVNAEVPNVFIHTGSGQDGINVISGNNILDGSTNSNFLIGGTGHDTFYLDDRNPSSPIFSTIVNFHSGDNATVFGVTQTGFQQLVLDNQGAAGYTGVDLIYSATGHVDTSFVLAGYTSADLKNGKLSMAYNTEPDGTPYMTLHAN